MVSRSRSRERYRSRSPRSRSRGRSLTPMSEHSQSPDRRHRLDSRSPSRSPNGPRNGRGRSRERERSRSHSWSRDRESRGRSDSPAVKSTKIVVERLTKNINEDHLREIFGQFGPIRDMDLPMNRQFNTNRGTAYILFVHESDAEAAIAHMHEAQIDGAVVNVSIVLPPRKLSPQPPRARRGANYDPRNPPPGGRASGPPLTAPGYPSGRGFPGGPVGRRRSPAPAGQYGPRSDTYRPRSVSRSLSRSPDMAPPSRSGAARYRSRSNSYSSRSRSRTPPRRRGGGGGGRRYDNGYDARRRSPSRSSYDSYNGRNRSRSRSRGRESRTYR